MKTFEVILRDENGEILHPVIQAQTADEAMHKIEPECAVVAVLNVLPRAA